MNKENIPVHSSMQYDANSFVHPVGEGVHSPGDFYQVRRDPLFPLEDPTAEYSKTSQTQPKQLPDNSSIDYNQAAHNRPTANSQGVSYAPSNLGPTHFNQAESGGIISIGQTASSGPAVFLRTATGKPAVYSQVGTSGPANYPQVGTSGPVIYAQATGRVPAVYPQVTNSIPAVFPQAANNAPGHFNQTARSVHGHFNQAESFVPPHFYQTPSSGLAHFTQATSSEPYFNQNQAVPNVSHACRLRDTILQPLVSQGSDANLVPVQNKDITVQRAHNYVYNVLDETYEGTFQIAAYDYEENPDNYAKLLKQKKTTYFSKNKVAKLIVNHEFKRTNSHFIAPSRFQELATLTARIFPNTLAESYYSHSTKTKSASGSFQTYYTKQREKEIAINRLVQHSLKRTISDTESVPTEELEDLRKEIDKIDESYALKWLNTAFNERIAFYKASDVNKILSYFPDLKITRGEILIKGDFKKFFDKPADIFKEKWPALAAKIVKVAKTKRADVEIKDILSANTPFAGREHEQVVALILLPYLFKRVAKVTTKSRSQTNWVPSKLEVLKTFVFHKTSQLSNECVKEAKEELVLLCGEHKLMVKPFVVIQGPSLREIKASFVLIEDGVYQVDCVLDAVDLCFQATKIFFEDFPIACSHVWQLLEKEVYQFPLEHIYSITATVLERLRKL